MSESKWFIRRCCTKCHGRETSGLSAPKGTHSPLRPLCPLQAIASDIASYFCKRDIVNGVYKSMKSNNCHDDSKFSNQASFSNIHYSSTLYIIPAFIAMAPLVWLVTGCSSGFGKDFVNEILSRGDKVIATARRLESLEDLKKAGAAVLQLDVTWDQERINETFKNAIQIYGQLDVLINNAAFVLGGAWEDLS